AAVYMLSVVQKVFFGPLTNPKNKGLPDLTTRETLALAPLVVLIFVIGLFPSVLNDRTKDSVDLLYNQFKAVSGQVVNFGDDRDAKMLPDDMFAPAFLKGQPLFEDTKKEEAPSGAPQAKNEVTR